MTSRPAKIEVWKGHDLRWYGHRRSANGKITDATPRGYARRGVVLAWAERSFPGLVVVEKSAPPIVVSSLAILSMPMERDEQ